MTWWWFKCVLRVLVQNNIQRLIKNDDFFSAVPVLPGSAETLFSWGVKIHQLLIAQWLGNVYAENCESWIMFARVRAKKNCRGYFSSHSVYYVPVGSWSPAGARANQLDETECTTYAEHLFQSGPPPPGMKIFFFRYTVDKTQLHTQNGNSKSHKIQMVYRHKISNTDRPKRVLIDC